MRQKLFTKQIDDMLFKQYAMGNELSKQKVVAKIFNPYGRGVWYLLNSDPSDPDYIWAIVDLFEVEVGSVSRESLEMMKVPPFGLNLERDIYFQPMNAGELLNRLYQGETFANGGKVRGYKIYHDTLSQTLQEAEDFFHNEGYLFTSDNYFPDVTVGGVGYGETARITRPIQLQGKSKGGVANIQIYRMDSGKYELNMYPSYADGGEMEERDSMSYARTKGKESIDWDKELREYAGSNYSKLSQREKEEIISDMQKDFDRNYFADGGELQIIKNESGENYLANADSTPNEMAVKLANGGSIPNNYRGRTTEDIWNSLTEDQRVHFMFDHFDELGVKENEIVRIANKEFQDLNEDVKGAFKTHTMMGQYADGGYMAKGGQVSGYFVFRPYKLEGNFYVNTTIQNELPNSVIMKGLEGKLKGDDINSAENIAHNIMQNHPEIAVLDIIKLGATTLKNKKVASFVRDDSGEYQIQYFEDGGMTNLSRDRMFKSQQSWEQKYQRKTRPKNPHYKKFGDGGRLNNYDRGVVREDMEKFVSIAKTSKDGKDFIDKARKITNVNPTTSSWFFDRYEDLDMNKASDKFVKEVKDGTFNVEKIYADGGMMAKGGITYKELERIGYNLDENNSIFAKRFQGAKNKNGDVATGLIIFDNGKDSLGEFVYIDKNGQEYQSKEMPNFSIDMMGSSYYGKMADGGYMEKEKNWFVIKNDDGTFSAYNSEIDRSEKEYDMTFKTELEAKNYIKNNYPKSMMAKGGGVDNFHWKNTKNGTLLYSNNEYQGVSITKNSEGGYYVTADEGYRFYNDFEPTEVDTISQAKAYANKEISYKMAKGGKTTFKDKVKSISKSLLKRKKVAPSVQKDYGKTYDKKEAVESAKRIVGAIKKKAMAKNSKLKVKEDDFSFLNDLTERELSKRLDLVQKQQVINSKQYFSARDKKQSTTKIEESRIRLDKQERAIIEARLKKMDKKKS
jgi:uncharacterized protein (UPF0254 family)